MVRQSSELYIGWYKIVHIFFLRLAAILAFSLPPND